VRRGGPGNELLILSETFSWAQKSGYKMQPEDREFSRRLGSRYTKSLALAIIPAVFVGGLVYPTVRRKFGSTMFASFVAISAASSVCAVVPAFIGPRIVRDGLEEMLQLPTPLGNKARNTLLEFFPNSPLASKAQTGDDLAMNRPSASAPEEQWGASEASDTNRSGGSQTQRAHSHKRAENVQWENAPETRPNPRVRGEDQPRRYETTGQVHKHGAVPRQAHGKEEERTYDDDSEFYQPHSSRHKMHHKEQEHTYHDESEFYQPEGSERSSARHKTNKYGDDVL